MTTREINGCTVLEASPGMRIVKSGGFICGTMAWLAGSDSVDNYSEITEEEARRREEAQEGTAEDRIRPDMLLNIKPLKRETRSDGDGYGRKETAR